MKSLVFIFLSLIPLIATSNDVDSRKVKIAKLNAEMARLEYKKAASEFRNGKKDEAIKLYSKSCDKNHAEACFAQGFILEESGNKKEALQLYIKACNLDDSTACVHQGSIQEKDGNIDESFKAMKKGCELQELLGCYFAGLIATKKSLKPEAIKFYKTACDGNYQPGCLNLGIAEYEKGNKENGSKILRNACEADNLMSCSMLGLFKFKEGNNTEAAIHLKKACEGSKQKYDDFSDSTKYGSCHGLALIEEEKGNKQEAEKLFKIECDAGFSDGCEALKTRNSQVSESHRANKTEGLECISWLLSLEELDKKDPILKAKYLFNMAGWVAMHSDIGPHKAKNWNELAAGFNANPSSCAKTKLEIPKFKMFERFVKSSNKKAIPEKIISCAKAMSILDSVAVKTGDKNIANETYEIGLQMGSSISALNEKFNLKEKVNTVLTVKPIDKKYSQDYLNSSEFKGLKSNCSVFNE